MNWIPKLLLVVLLAPSVQAQLRFTFAQLPDETVWSRLESFSTKNPEREAELKTLFEQAGCATDRLSEEKVAHSSLPNVICVLPGETDRTILVGAHFDKVNPGDGVVDNWSGAAMLPSLLEALSKDPRKHTYVFLGFTDEEKGLVGSDYHVHHMSKEDRQKVSAMVNLDTVGLGPTEVWGSQADKNLLKALAIVANSMKIPISVMNVDGVGSSDSESFHQNKIPALTIHSVTSETLKILHSNNDKLSAVRKNDYLATYRMMCGYLAFLDVHLDQPPPEQSTSQKPEK